jgi:hypothetical protein
MSEKINEVVEILPQASRNIPVSDDKFLFFFDPVNVEEKFMFGLTLKNGVLIFAVITLIQAISSFFDIFSPDSFWLFLVAIVAFIIYFVISVYAFLGALKENYSYIRVSYLIISALFLIEALRYVCKSVIKVIEFITPWDGDFLRLDFLVYIFGYGMYLFIYLYFIYILFRYMNQLKNPSQGGISLPQNNEEQVNLNDEEKMA